MAQHICSRRKMGKYGSRRRRSEFDCIANKTQRRIHAHDGINEPNDESAIPPRPSSVPPLHMHRTLYRIYICT